MREIKFRVYNPSGSNMLYDIDNVFECLKQQISFDKTMPDRGFVIPYDHRKDGMKWMQFTGLKDKNGKEIYEGDIIRSSINALYQIQFFNGSFRMIPKIKPFENAAFAINNEGMTRSLVSGNIHENPELWIP